jgi:hypothetical protein
MTRLFWTLAVDVAATGAGLVAGVWAASRRESARGARPRVWPWFVGGLSALALDTFLTTFPTISGRLPLWLERHRELALWALTLAMLALGVARVGPRRITRALPCVLVLIVLHAALSWPMASGLPDVRPDGQVVQSRSWSSVPAAAANFLQLYGIDASERDMADLFGTTIRGTSPVGVIDGLARLGMRCDVEPFAHGFRFAPALLFSGAGINPKSRLVLDLPDDDTPQRLMELLIECDDDPRDVRLAVERRHNLSFGPRRLLYRSAERACPPRDSDYHYFPPLAFYVSYHYAHRAADLGSEHRIRNWHSAVLRGMNEPSLSCGHAVTRTYRFLWMPAFHPDLSVRVDADSSGATITTTAVGQDGSILEHRTTRLDGAAWHALQTEIENSRIEEDASTSIEGMGTLDGVRIIFEARKQDRYKLVYRANPLSGPIVEVGKVILRVFGGESGKVLIAEYLPPFNNVRK